MRSRRCVKPVISYILPTRNRPRALAASLEALGRLGGDLDRAAEVIVVDNASEPPAAVANRLANGIRVRSIRLSENEAAASRNIAARESDCEWLVMLDDDSHPVDSGFIEILAGAAPEVAAVGADIRLPDGSREAGGLPEVFVGCGVAIRRGAFCEVGGYDPAFHFYAEEYDLAARLIIAGHVIEHDGRFRVRHSKVTAGRDMDLILRRLVRNNGWIAGRYAPRDELAGQLIEVIDRYGELARRENAVDGYLKGLGDLLATIDRQPRRPMTPAHFDRFTGLAHVRQALGASTVLTSPETRVAIIEAGKNAWVVRRVLGELGCEIVSDEREAEALVIGTLSPGPMLDACDRHRGSAQPVIAPWILRQRAKAVDHVCRV